MKNLIEQTNAYLQMYRTLIVGKIENERGATAVEYILMVLAGIAIAGLIVAAVTMFAQNRTAQLGV